MKRNDWIFVQDSAPSRRSNLVQNFLMEKLHIRFVKHTEWPSDFPDCNPLYYHIWDQMKIKVCGDRFNKAFVNEKD